MLRRFTMIAAALGLVLTLTLPRAASAQSISGSAFGATWAYADLPVATKAASRTWMWGAQPDTGALLESYVDSPGGKRVVQYFDKSRMEITHPNADPNSLWYVTNGLIAEELVTGRMQLGDNTFAQYAPAQINVAGDQDDPSGPTYATFWRLLNYGALPNGWTITQTVNRAGIVTQDTSLSAYHVTAKDVGAPTYHDVASVFWSFMTGSGTVYRNGYDRSALFPNPFYATGYPLTEAYWTTVLLKGVPTRVLVQVFERRVLTYTPSNPSGWQVESGNVGQHYYQWRYVMLKQTPVADPTPPAPWSPPGQIASVSIPGASISYYDVNGSTANQLAQSLNRFSTASGDYASQTSWTVSWETQSQSDGTCRALNVAAKITVTFPRWNPAPGTSPVLISDWNRFIQALATHEEGHVQRVTNNIPNLEAAINRGSCQVANAAAQGVMAQIQRQNDAYDAQTNHGVSQGATFP